MWTAKEDGSYMQMAVGDFGIQLPFSVSDVTLTQSDTIRFAFARPDGSGVVLTKNYNNPQNNTVNLEFTEAESALFSVGKYLFSMDWYRGEELMCNLIKAGIFEVAGKVK